MQFAIVDDQLASAGRRDPQHFQPQSGWCFRLITVYGMCQWDQVDRIEIEQFACVQGDAQMTVVDRVKGAAEDTDYPATLRLLRYGCVHRPGR